MVDIEEFTSMVESVMDELDPRYLEGLNGGVLVLEEVRQHWDAPPGTLVLGEYVVRPWLGSHIAIYYGSFVSVYPGMDRQRLLLRVRDVVLHELRHHVETRAGVKDLALADRERIARMWHGSLGRRAKRED